MIFVTSGGCEPSIDDKGSALEFDRDLRVVERSGCSGGTTLIVRDDAGGGVELLDEMGVTVCLTDRVDARERVLTAVVEHSAWDVVSMVGVGRVVGRPRRMND